ncbi:hypothetical protein FA13DRAFT_1795391 [Coprinellus micaceus]|uniref:Uncharacterized protein n=1 Tax=Coprinellus micaceus TaxID=71717 RepID=A0A4Y7SXX3_COPMI|nr:hypothetical protein FA13DRAFT_1795391 [Coprinellus micaceus]
MPITAKVIRSSCPFIRVPHCHSGCRPRVPILADSFNDVNILPLPPAKDADAERIQEYRRNYLRLPSEVDRWLKIASKCQTPPEEPTGQDAEVARDFPRFGINDHIKCTIHIQEVPDEEDGLFVETTEWSLNMTMAIEQASGLIVPILPSPPITLATYVGLQDRSNDYFKAPKWVLNEGVVDGLEFYQPRARMIEMVKTLIEMCSIPITDDTKHIRAWLQQASLTNILRQVRAAEEGSYTWISVSFVFMGLRGR